MKPKYLSRAEQQKIDRAFRRAFRTDAHAEQRGKCHYCLDPITIRQTTAEHLRPRKFQGRDERNNIVAACEPCNSLRGHMPLGQFRSMVERPRHGDPIGFWLAWSRRRINRRLEVMEKRLIRFFIRKAGS